MRLVLSPNTQSFSKTAFRSGLFLLCADKGLYLMGLVTYGVRLVVVSSDIDSC